MMQKLKQYWWVFGILLLLIIVALVVSKRRQAEPTYAFVKPEIRNIVSSYEVSGTIEADRSVDLYFPTVAKLTWVGVHEGERVKQWQAVASVDVRTLEKQLQADLNTYAKQRIDFEATKDDYNDDVLTNEIKRILEKSQYDLNNSVLAVEIRDLAIKLSTLSTPIAGVVTRVDNPIAGVTIGPTSLIQVVDPASIYFRVVVDEEDVTKLSLDQTASIELDAYDGQTLESKVGAIAFNASPSENGGTGYEVKLSLPVDNEQLNYRLGMNGTAQIKLDEKDQVLSLPIDVLISRDGASYVQVKNSKGGVEDRQIQIGLENDTYFEIVSGLESGEEVVLPSKD